MLPTLPVTVMVALLLAPAVKPSAAVLPRVRVPLVTVRVTRIRPSPASASSMEMRLLLAEEKASGVFMLVNWAPGTLLTGGLLGAGGENSEVSPVSRLVAVAVMNGRAGSRVKLAL